MRDRDFRIFWGGAAISDLGSAVTYLALPLTAILVLGAGPREMGGLVALQQLPVPLFGLLAGVWVDRLRRRPLMIAADLARALLLAVVPLTALLGVLSLELLLGIAFAIGTLTVLFDLGITSYLPSLVSREHLLEANAKLQVTAYIAATAGRALGGAVVQALTAPMALLADTATFGVSAAALASIRRPEPGHARPRSREGVGREIAAGLRFTLRQPAIASMTLVSTLGALGGAVQQAVFFLFLANELGFPSVYIGAITAAHGGAAWLGAWLGGRLAGRTGPGPAMIASSFVGACGAALLPLAALGIFRAMPTLIVGQGLMGLGLALYSVSQISLRQALTPDVLLGRVNATRRVVVFGAIPFGALAGGALGAWLGLRGTLALGAGLLLLSGIVALVSPLRAVRSIPTHAATI